VERTLFGKPARFEGGLHEVAPGVFAWLQPNGEWGESNAGVVVGDGEALLVDTLWDTRLTRRMLDAVNARVGVPIKVVVNTHSDGDHVWGNQLLDGARIISTDTAIEIIREEPPAALQRFKSVARPLRLFGTLPLPVVGTLPLPLLPRLHLRELGGYVENMLGPYDFSDVQLRPPTQGFSGGLVGEAGGREVRLIEVGPAHTPGDLIVHVPDADVVFAADVMFVGVVPVMWAGPTGNWLAALERILSLDPAVVVPGHGPISGPAEVRALRDYLAWVDAAAQQRLARGSSVMETARELVLDEGYRDAPWGHWDSPERIVITIATIDRHRRGDTGGVGGRERAQLFAQVAALAAELERRG
jgi:glyoxylase-like metal-dependent hydrolase (beta-lactamase superfamily II)